MFDLIIFWFFINEEITFTINLMAVVMKTLGPALCACIKSKIRHSFLITIDPILVLLLRQIYSNAKLLPDSSCQRCQWMKLVLSVLEIDYNKQTSFTVWVKNVKIVSSTFVTLSFCFLFEAFKVYLICFVHFVITKKILKRKNTWSPV